jgi:hypothetical protein
MCENKRFDNIYVRFEVNVRHLINLKNDRDVTKMLNFFFKKRSIINHDEVQPFESKRCKPITRNGKYY